MAGSLDIAMVLRLIDEASNPLRAIVAQMEALNGAAAKASGGGTINLGGVAATVEKMDLLAKTLSSVGQPAAAATAAMDRLESVTAGLSAPVTAATEALDAQAKALSAVEGAANAAGAAQRKVGAAMPGGPGGGPRGPRGGSAADSYMQAMSNAGMASMGFSQLSGLGGALKHPLAKAIDGFSALQKGATDVAIAADSPGQGAAFADDILQSARISHQAVADVLAGQRKLAQIGGATLMPQIVPVEGRLNKLLFAGNIDAPDGYATLKTFMAQGGLSARRSVSAMEGLYGQGKKGPFELRDMAYFLPSVLPMAMGLGGETAPQFLKHQTPFLQTLRATSGDAFGAVTKLIQVISHLAMPQYQKSIKKTLGVDLPGVQAAARQAHKDPLYADELAIATAIRTKVAAGADQAVLIGKLGRDHYFQSAIITLLQHQKDWAGLAFDPKGAKAQTAADFGVRASTMAAHQQDQATAGLNLAYQAGATQQKLMNTALGAQTAATRLLTSAITAHPLATSALGGTAYVAGGALDGIGKVGMGAMGLSTLINSMKWMMASAKTEMAVTTTAEAALGVEAAGAAGALFALVGPVVALAAPFIALGAALGWLKGQTDQFKFRTHDQKAKDVAHQIADLNKQIGAQTYGSKQYHLLTWQRNNLLSSQAAARQQHQLYPHEGRGNTFHHSTGGKDARFEALLAAQHGGPVKIPPPVPPLPPVVKVTQPTPVTVHNHITINATTNASAGELGAAVAHAAARGTRAGVAALHDGFEFMGHH